MCDESRAKIAPPYRPVHSMKSQSRIFAVLRASPSSLIAPPCELLPLLNVSPCTTVPEPVIRSSRFEDPPSRIVTSLPLPSFVAIVRFAAVTLIWDVAV